MRGSLSNSLLHAQTRMTPHRFSALFLTGLLSLTSCATRLTPAQKQQMTALRLSGVRTLPNAYSSPNFTSQKEAATSQAMSNPGLFGFAGALLSGAVIAADNARDASVNRAATQTISSHVTKDLGPALSAKVTSLLKADPFYGPRLSTSASAPARIDITIPRYQLSSLNDVQFRTLVGADVNVYLNNLSIHKKGFSNGMPLPGRPAVSAPSLSATLSEYAANPKLLQDHLDQAVTELAENIVRDLKAFAAEN